MGMGSKLSLPQERLEDMQILPGKRVEGRGDILALEMVRWERMGSGHSSRSSPWKLAGRVLY